MNAIVVTFDRLPMEFLGCCGNHWIATPNFDRLASESALFQQHFADSPAPDPACRAWWSGRYTFRGDQTGTDRLWLPALMADRGVTFRLLVEATGDKATPEALQFPAEKMEVVRGRDGLDVATEDTPFFRLVARAQRDLRLLRTSRSEPWLLWIKSQGVPVPWLAPRAFATQFLDVADDDEGDSDPEDSESDDRESDDRELGDDEAEEGGEDEAGDADDKGLVEMSGAEFDQLLRSMAQLPADRHSRDGLSGVERGLMRRVCGGYVALLDAALGRLLAQIDHDAATAPTLLIVTAARGITVREPGLLLGDWEHLAEESVHTPLFLRATGMNRGIRNQELMQTVDLFPTLAEWFGIDVSAAVLDGKSLLPAVRGDKHEPRSHALIADAQSLAGIRTSDFYLVTQRFRDQGSDEQGTEEEPAQRRLFAKPEDIWETNNIAAQSPDVADQLADQLVQLVADEEPPV